MFPEPSFVPMGDLAPGMRTEYVRDISEETVVAFANVSGDFNPIHIDKDHAASVWTGGCIAHGAFQIGLASELAGMYLPGRDVLLTSVVARFPNPLQVPNSVTVHGEILSWNAAAMAGRIKVKVSEKTSGLVTGEIDLGFTMQSKLNR